MREAGGRVQEVFVEDSVLTDNVSLHSLQGFNAPYELLQVT